MSYVKAVPGGWRRMYAQHTRLWDMLVSWVCLQEQRKTSLLLAYIEILSHVYSLFCASNSWPAFCLAVSLPRFRVRHWSPPHAPRIRPMPSAQKGLHVWQLSEVRESVYNVLNMDILFTKHIDSLQEAFFHPRSRVRHVLLWMDALYLTSFGKNTRPLPL